MIKQNINAVLAATLIPFLSFNPTRESDVVLRSGLPVPLVVGVQPIIYTPRWSRNDPSKYFQLDQKKPLKSMCDPSDPSDPSKNQPIAHVRARACVYNLSFFLISVFNYIKKCLDHLDHALFFNYLRLDHFWDQLDHLDHADYKGLFYGF